MEQPTSLLSRCAQCGREIPPGMPMYGTSEIATGATRFRCRKCAGICPEPIDVVSFSAPACPACAEKDAQIVEIEKRLSESKYEMRERGVMNDHLADAISEVKRKLAEKDERIKELEREVERARMGHKESAEWKSKYSALCGDNIGLTERLAGFERSLCASEGKAEALQAALEEVMVRMRAAERESERWRHGAPIEGDYVCPSALQASSLEAALKEIGENLVVYQDAHATDIARVSNLEAALAEVSKERDEAVRVREHFGAMIREIMEAFGTPICVEQADLPSEVRRLVAARDEARARCERMEAALRAAEELICHAAPVTWTAGTVEAAAGWEKSAVHVLDAARAALATEPENGAGRCCRDCAHFMGLGGGSPLKPTTNCLKDLRYPWNRPGDPACEAYEPSHSVATEPATKAPAEKRCPRCEGSGKSIVRPAGPFGRLDKFGPVCPCPACGGKGMVKP